MKKIFTLLSAMLLATGVFAATEQAWYNDVTSIASNGQYYIYSVNGKGFMQGGNSKVKAVTQNNYNSESNLLFTIAGQNGAKTHSGSNYLSSYQYGTNGPIGDESTSGTNIYWTSMNNGQYWNIHGKYNFLGDKYACLQYDGGYSGLANVLGQKETHTDAKSQWYLVSPAQYDRHWAIYLYDRYKESISDYTKWENLVPAAYYAALSDAYAVTYNVKNAAHSKEVVVAHRTELTNLYNNAEEVADAYAAAKGAIETLEAVEDKGEDFAEVTTDIANARTAIEVAMTVDALNAAVAGLKAIDPITFNVTEFEVLNFVTNAASSVAGRAIAYDAADKTIINAEGQAIYAGTTTLTATAAATEQYYKFVRSAQVTVTAPTTYGEFSATTCGEAVEFNEQTYEESFAGEVHLTNIYGGDSVVTVAITINHPTFGTDEKTIVYGDEAEWNGISLKDSTVGEHTVIFVTSNAAGCDSTVTLTLTVNKLAAVEIPVDMAFCAGGSDFFRGVEYSEAGTYPVNVTGATRDTVYNVTVTVLQPTTGTDTKTIVYGAEEEWNGISLKDSTVGVHYVVYETTNVAGCDSTVTLTLTVNKMDTLEVYYPIGFCTGDSAEYRGKWYYEYALDTIYAEGDVRDTIIYVEVTLLPTTDLFVLYDTIVSGNEVILPEGEWVIGEDTVSGTYPTVESEDASELIFHQYFDEPVVCGPNYIELVVTVTPKEQKPGDTTTDIEDVLDAQKAEKVLIDGVLYIRRGKRLFTAEGREVK